MSALKLKRRSRFPMVFKTLNSIFISVFGYNPSEGLLVHSEYFEAKLRLEVVFFNDRLDFRIRFGI